LALIGKGITIAYTQVGNAMRDGGLGLARFSAVCPLGGHMHANGLLYFVVYGTQVCQVLHVWA
jgi:hypothetical protein